MTLVELVVAMGIFLIFVSLILGTTVTLAQSASRAQLVAEASNSTLTVFGAFDRQTRYADSINFPTTLANNNRYVEFHTPGTSSVSGKPLCTQWRFVPSKGLIELRTWDDTVGAPIGAWSTKESNVIDDLGGDYPFSLTQATNSVPIMQLLTVKIHAGNANLDAGAAISTSFVARNSSISSPSNADAKIPHVSDNPVCTAGVRK